MLNNILKNVNLFVILIFLYRCYTSYSFSNYIIEKVIIYTNNNKKQIFDYFLTFIILDVKIL